MTTSETSNKDYQRLTISSWPTKERPRERLIEHGPQSLSTAELIAIILRTGSKSVSAVDLAIALLKRFDNLHGIDSASIKELAEVKGLGNTKAAMLKAAFELGKRLIAEQPTDLISFDKPEAVFNFVWSHLKFKKQEGIICLCLDSRNRLISHKEIFLGTANRSLLNPKEIFAYALREFASGIIIVHNHPSGNPQPSADDISITTRIKNAGELLGISLIDHIIIGGDSFYSMKRNDYI